MENVSSEEELLELRNEGKISEDEYKQLLETLQKPANLDIEQAIPDKHQPAETSGLAIASLIFSLIGPIGSIPAVICGHLALRRIGRQTEMRGRGLAIAGLILYLAYGLFKRTLPVLLDERAIEAEQIRTAVQSVDGVHAVRRIRSRWVGSALAVDLVIEVDAQLSTTKAHKIADEVEVMLADRLNAQDASIHVEPHISKEAS